VDTTLIGKRLRQARRAQDLTQPELGKKAGVSYNTISRLERGNALHVAAETVYDLAVALGVSLDWVYGRTERCKP
jgi:transcriptional regulator with XRE-family HTH domain